MDKPYMVNFAHYGEQSVTESFFEIISKYDPNLLENAIVTEHKNFRIIDSNGDRKSYMRLHAGYESTLAKEIIKNAKETHPEIGLESHLFAGGSPLLELYGFGSVEDHIKILQARMSGAMVIDIENGFERSRCSSRGTLFTNKIGLFKYLPSMLDDLVGSSVIPRSVEYHT